MLEATVHLLYAAPRINYGRLEHYLNLYKAIMIMIFSATLQLNADIQQTNINDVVAKMQAYFSEWICGTNSGREMFGGDKCVNPRTAVLELKVLYGKIKITMLFVHNLFVLVLL